MIIIPRIIEWRTWEEYDKYSKQKITKGVARVDYSTSDDVLEANVRSIYNNFHEKVNAVVKKMKVSSASELPGEVMKKFQNDLAGDLREAYGKDRNDASYKVPLRSVDMVKACERLGFSTDDHGWEQVVLNAIEVGDI